MLQNRNEVCSAIWMGRQEWISSSLFQRPDVFWLFARPCLYLQRKICVHERMHLFWAKSILHRPLPCQAGDLCRNENTHLAISRNTDEDDDIWSHFFSFSSSLHLFHRIKLLLSKLWSQLPRLPVDVFCFIETWSNVCFRQASPFYVLSKLRQVHTYYVFSVNSSFICCNVFKVFFLYVVVVMS